MREVPSYKPSITPVLRRSDAIRSARPPYSLSSEVMYPTYPSVLFVESSIEYFAASAEKSAFFTSASSRTPSAEVRSVSWLRQPHRSSAVGSTKYLSRILNSTRCTTRNRIDALVTPGRSTITENRYSRFLHDGLCTKRVPRRSITSRTPSAAGRSPSAIFDMSALYVRCTPPANQDRVYEDSGRREEQYA
jgi:hypothetical protein